MGEQKEKRVEKVRILDFEIGSKGIIAGNFYKKESFTKNKDPYWCVRICDNMNNSCYARVWNNLPIYNDCTVLENGDYVEAEVVCTEKKEKSCFVEIVSIKKVDRVEETFVDIEALKTDLKKILKNMKDKELRKLINNVLRRPEVNEAFFLAPATTESGYSFKGGLLAHVVRIIKLIKAFCITFSEWKYNTDGITTRLNEDFLITCAILHDVGKIKTLKFNDKSKIERTEEGWLFDDSYSTLRIVHEELAKSKLSNEKKMLIEHVIGSSRGLLQHGATFIPRSREAFAFHLIEKLDIQMANFEFLDRNSTDNDVFLKLFEKNIFIGIYE